MKQFYAFSCPTNDETYRYQPLHTYDGAFETLQEAVDTVEKQYDLPVGTWQEYGAVILHVDEQGELSPVLSGVFNRTFASWKWKAE